METRPAGLSKLTAEIVEAFAANNTLSVDSLTTLIADVHAALGRASNGEPEAAREPQEPAVPFRRSVTADHIVCLEDGKQFKSLKRHLRTHHDMTPDEYRAKWDLKRDYPMASPRYSEARAELARAIGLGRKPKATSSRSGSAELPRPAAARNRGRRSRARR